MVVGAEKVGGYGCGVKLADGSEGSSESGEI